MAIIVLGLNFYLRICFRFLAAMRLNLFTYAHPVFLSSPLLFIFFYIFCQFAPICQLDIIAKYFELNIYCVKGKPVILLLLWTWTSCLYHKVWIQLGFFRIIIFLGFGWSPIYFGTRILLMGIITIKLMKCKFNNLKNE